MEHDVLLETLLWCMDHAISSFEERSVLPMQKIGNYCVRRKIPPYRALLVMHNERILEALERCWML
jgi:hypothetical protein